MHAKNLPRKTALITTILLILASPLYTLQAANFDLTQTSEYNQFVHTYYDIPQGNITYLDKPIFPIYLNESQIPIGGNWTISCPLEAGHNYRVFLYGKWASVTATASTAKTDYDLYVYNPQGVLEASRTEAAGVIEYITSGDSNFFTPKHTGNYTFLIKNDARESSGAEPATFMIIENIECNKWFTVPIEGKNSDSTSRLRTAWAYEFTTVNDTYVEVHLEVPSSLDMYEARLYLMTDAQSPTTRASALPTELGLYGVESSGKIGGYNFDTNGSSRGVSYASCPARDQDMILNHTSHGGINHYYLALIGEEGAGNVKLLIKTIFQNVTLSQVGATSKVFPDTAVNLSYKTDGINLEAANLTYTTDSWVTSKTIRMIISEQTCNATIPGQPAGTTVEYTIDALDTVRNSMQASGSFSVKTQPTLTINVAEETVFTGQSIMVTGTMTPAAENAVVTLTFFSSKETQTVECAVNGDGTFSGSYAPTSEGQWAVIANAAETKSTWAADSAQYVVTVKEMPLYQKYATYIAAALIIMLFVGGAVYFLRFNGR